MIPVAVKRTRRMADGPYLRQTGLWDSLNLWLLQRHGRVPPNRLPRTGWWDRWGRGKCVPVFARALTFAIENTKRLLDNLWNLFFIRLCHYSFQRLPKKTHIAVPCCAAQDQSEWCREMYLYPLDRFVWRLQKKQRNWFPVQYKVFSPFLIGRTLPACRDYLSP